MRTYSGHVVPGGTPAVHELAHLIVTKLSVGGAWNNNVYVLRCRDTGQELIVDAAAEPDRITASCGDGPVVRIVTTHRHADHWRALDDVVDATGATTVAHVDDAPAIAVPTAEPVTDGEHVRFGRCELEVVHLVGHTPGSVALLYDDPTGPPHLWTGDSLFPGGPGRTTTPEDFTSLMDDLEAKIFERLPDETWVYPGHGDDTTLGRERPQLTQWRERGW
ncbi:glyoxylase-like metal-dependent hydrolase (beta-lactamase superfamily II) [Haloactinopolyspora alba]|uniref:Glyoxylase-like metal-dependent hydrolase (Beta-lactamase superfamily II) n=1 Tax=Haloactinopolyspora alba TaxID=648780 RepID=A0A2P8E3K6_9ACTN|nr:MBL fold metallo-hydrolase [Haloactinopolyspora alba]PSL04058.1 glyoxylase-like metal-dependent hydrolase (beta-lactamase superfamily II) [Haloactinopolyspora alba]